MLSVIVGQLCGGDIAEMNQNNILSFEITLLHK